MFAYVYPSYVIVCDAVGCEEKVGVKQRRPSNARREAERSHGFMRDGDKDYCPEHHPTTSRKDIALMCPSCGHYLWLDDHDVGDED